VKRKTIADDKRQRADSNQVRELTARYRKLLAENQELEERVKSVLEMRKGVTTHTIKASQKSGHGEATAFIVASDWHIEETVKAESVYGLNEYSLEIARQRADRFFKNSLILLNICKRDIKIKTIVLALLGDFITNQIHEELMETNSVRPIDAIKLVQGWLVSGIEFLLKHTDCELIIPCCSGNHGRITKRIHHSTEQGNSLEHLMYYSLSLNFRGNKRVKFIINESYHTFLEVYGQTIRLHHGHAIRYQGGVGGLSIPLNKAIAQWNKAKEADLDVCAHWHSFKDTGNCIVNGSLIGYNAYAVAIKADYEKPKQAFFLIDSKRGKTIVAPVIVHADI